MTDSDDWENQLDSDNEADKKKEEDKKKKFDDEDVVDAETIKKQKAEQAKKEQQEKELKAKKDNALNKDLNGKKNYDELWESRQKGLPGTSTINTEGMTDAQKGLAMQMEAEGQMTNDLFGDDDVPSKTMEKVWKLNSEKEYKEFGKHTAKILYKGSTPYRTENFFRELCREMPEHLDSKQIGSIVEYMKSIFNQKQKEEKAEKDGKNKKKKKIELKGGGGKGYEFNNNPGMVNDVMGGPTNDDDYGDYGDEQGFKREGEGEYDFM